MPPGQENTFELITRRIRSHEELWQPWSGFCYRVTSLDYPIPASILSGEGSFRHGGRWNAIGSFRVVYGSTEDVVAVKESRATADYFRIGYPFRAARLLVTIEFRLARVLDLTAGDTRRALELSREALEEDWRRDQENGHESFTQAIGRAAFECGAEALLAPSLRVTGGINIAFFPANLGQASWAQVNDSERLSRIRI